MKFQNLTFVSCFCINTILLLPLNGTTVQKISPEERYARYIEQIKRDGGLVKIGGDGLITIHHNLPLSLVDELEQSIVMFQRTLRIEVKCQIEKSISITDVKYMSKVLNDNPHIFIIDNPNLPPSLIAPEARWAMINLDCLDCKDDNAKFGHRLKVAFLRTACRLLGAGTSKFEKSCMYPVAKVSDFDNLKECFITVDSMISILQYIESIGIKPYQIKSYKDACEEGWAPAPTNDIQKAIWERVKADKERGPTNPLKIPMPKRK